MVGTLIYDCGWKVKWYKLPIKQYPTTNPFDSDIQEKQLPLYPGVLEVELKSGIQVEFEELINRAGEKFAIIRTKLDDTWEHIYDKWRETTNDTLYAEDFYMYLKSKYKVPNEY